MFCILSVSLATVPTNCQAYDKSGATLPSFSIIVFNLIEPISFRCDQEVESWRIAPSLPFGAKLNVTEGVISGQFTKVMPTTQYAITAKNKEGSTSFDFNITVIDCPHGNPLTIDLFYADSEKFTIFDGDKQVYYYDKSTNLQPSICLPYKTYKYTSICSRGDHNWCYIRVTDKNGTVFTEFRAPEMQLVNGTFEMIPTAAPIIFSKHNQVAIHVKRDVRYFFSASTMHTEFAFSPELPRSVKFNGLLSSLTGSWKEKGVYTYNVTCSNAMGSASLLFHVFVDMCGEPYKTLAFDRFRTQSGEKMNITNDNGELLLSTEFDGSTYSQLLCIEDGVYHLHLEGNKEEGWGRDSMFVHLLGDEIGEFVVPKGQHDVNEKVVIKKLITVSDSWSYHLGDLSDNWTNGKYREKDWKNGKSGEWGNFDESKIVLFRKEMELDDHYGSMILDVESYGFVELFVNGVLVWSDMTNGVSHRISLRGGLFGSKAILGIRLKQSSSFDDSIRFSMVLRPLLFSTVIRSENGLIESSPEGSRTDYKSDKAFDKNYDTFWLVDSLPATVTYMFANASVAVNSIYLFVDDWFAVGMTDMRVEGITSDNKATSLATITAPSFLSSEAYREIRLKNEIAYAGYRFYFNGKRIGFLRIRDIRLQVSNIQTCKKKIGLPSLETGKSHYKRCPFGKVGVREMRCENVDNEARWVDDRSSCVNRFPENGIAYVDSWFRLTNVTLWNEEKYVDGLNEVLVDQLTVKKKEIHMVWIRDESTENEAVVTVMLRFELEEAIGDYVLSHMKEMLPDIPRLFKEKMGSRIFDAYAESLKEPVLYEPIHWGSIVGSILKGAVLVVLTVTVTVCLMRPRSEVKSLSHKGMKKGDNESLLPAM